MPQFKPRPSDGVHRISKKSLAVWRIRVFIAAFFCALLTSLITENFSILWWIFTVTWIGLFLFFYCFYYPIKYKKLSFLFLGDGNIRLNTGVIYTRDRYLRREHVQYVKTVASPVQHLFKLRSVIVFAAGGRLFLSCLEPDQVELVRQQLDPTLAREDGK